MTETVAVEPPPPADHPGDVRAAFVGAENLESLGKGNAVGGVLETFRRAAWAVIGGITGVLEWH